MTLLERGGQFILRALRLTPLVAALLSLLLVAGVLPGAPPPRATAQARTYPIWAPVLYKGSAGWNSGIQVQNLGAQPATITVTYYQPDGRVAMTEPYGSVAAGSSRTFYLPGTSLPAGYAGSAAISADQPIAAIVNLTNYELPGSTAAASSYNAVDVPNRRINLPFISRNEFFSTAITVLNTGNVTTTIDVAMHELNGERVGGWPSLALGPFSSRTLDVSSPSSDRIGGANFIGSASVASSNTPVAVVVNVAFSNRLLSYRGESYVGNQLSLPLLMRARNGWNSLFTVRNDSDQAGEVRVRFFDEAGKAVEGADYEATIRPRGTLLVEQFSYDRLPPGFTGSGIVTSNVPFLTAIGVLNNDGLSEFTGYNAAYVANAGARLSAPLLMKNHRGWSTGLQIQNLSAQTADVTVQYYDTENNLVATEQVQLPPSAARTLYTPAVAALPEGFVGSAVLTSANQRLVGLVNLVNYGVPGDTAMTYGAIPY